MPNDSSSNSVVNQPGGVDIHAQTVNIYGDVTGRDKIDAGGSGGSTPSTGGVQPTPAAQPPLELSIRITAASPGALQVNVSVPGTGLSAGPVEFAIPLDNNALADLRWYLEVYPQWPVGPDYDRALKIEANLRGWGAALFDAVFGNAKTMRVYEQFRVKATVGLSITIDATDPRVLQLPWELLADQGGYLFTQQPPINVRRKLQTEKEAQIKPFTLPVRILMVISRPEGSESLDPRSSARALLDAIEPLGDRVTVEFLYPPTLAALTRRVRDPQLPPVHVVHFDGHGVYVPQTGLGYLLFENDEHEEQLVNADDLGTLLNDTGVPLMILDACQTARTDKANPFGSVASKLIEAGVGSVLAMNYSVFVTATRILTGAFYGALASGKTIGQAVDAARFEMLMSPERFKLYREGKEEAILLRDWFLPALYQQSSDPAPFSTPHQPPSVKRGEAGRGVPTYPARGGFPDEPRHGFHGREKELLHLQRTLADHAMIVLHGYGGQGKTALAAHAARWFTRIHRFERAIFVSFERGGGLEYALSEMGAALMGEDFAIHQGDPIDAIATALRETPTLVVWDNFETIMHNGDAPLPDDVMQQLLSAAAHWFSSPHSLLVTHYSSRLILTTRDPSIPHPAFEPSRTTAHTELPGLGLLDALDLAAQILKDRGIPRPKREPLLDLLGYLGGHPLSIQLVVPHLRDHTPEKLIAEFDELLPGFTTGAGKERNQSLEVSLNFSLRRLGEEMRKVLPDLAIFQGGAMEAMILDVTEWRPSEWRGIRDELIQAALLSVDQEVGFKVRTSEGDFIGHYAHFHPTLLPYLARQLVLDRRMKLETRYWQAYSALANRLSIADVTKPMPTRMLIMRELPNFRRAISLVLTMGDSSAVMELADRVAAFFDFLGRWSERDVLLLQVAKAQETSAEKRDVGEESMRAKYLMMSNEGKRLLQFGYAAKAEFIFRELLEQIDQAPSIDRVTTLIDLARCLRSQGKQNAAAQVYKETFDMLSQLEQTVDVKRKIGLAHTDFANVLAELGQFDAAREEYEASIVIKLALNDDRGVAVSVGQLGTLALRQNNLNEARRCYLQALEVFKQINEPQHIAIYTAQLGMVAQQAHDWIEAERCCKESLAIEERLNDAAGAALTCNQLAMVAEGAGRLDEAERWYKRSIELGEELGDKQRLATQFNNLANLYLAQNRLDEAEQCAQRVREIKETLDLSSEPWTTYNILAQIAERRGRAEEARQWRRKEQETYAAFAGSDFQIRQYQGLIERAAKAAAGDIAAKQWLEGEYSKMRTGGEEWAHTARTIQRIIAGERNADSLTENLSGMGALIVRRILMLLNAPPTRASAPFRTPPSTASTGEGSASHHSPVADGGRAGEGGQQGISLEALFNLVGAGLRGNQRAGQQAYEFTRVMQDKQQPPEVRAIGKGLQNILEGLRGDDAVQGLPPEAAQIVRLVLDQLS